MTEPRADAPVEGKLTLEIVRSESGAARSSQDAFMARLLAEDSGVGPLQELLSVLGKSITESIRVLADSGYIVYRGQVVGYERHRAGGFVEDAVQDLWERFVDRRDALRTRWERWPGGLSRFLVRMAHERLHKLTRSQRCQGRPVTSVEAQGPNEPSVRKGDDPQHVVARRELVSIALTAGDPVYRGAVEWNVSLEAHGREAPSKADPASQQDLAAALGVNKSTVSKNMKKERELARRSIRADEDWEATE